MGHGAEVTRDLPGADVDHVHVLLKANTLLVAGRKAKADAICRAGSFLRRSAHEELAMARCPDATAATSLIKI